MKARYLLVVTAAVLAVSGPLVSLPSVEGAAFTTPSTSNSQTFTGTTASVTRPASAAGTTSATNVAFVSGSNSFAQFSSSLGVLTQVNVVLSSSTRTPSISSQQGSGITFQGSGTASLAVPGGTANFGSVSATHTPGSNGAFAVNGTPDTSGANIAITTPSDLNSYVGAGSFNATRTAPSLSAQTSATTSRAATFTETWSGTLDTTYTFMLHSLPSFNSSSTAVTTLNIDLGTHTQGEGGGTFTQSGFSLFNPFHTAGSFTSTDTTNQVALDLDSISGSGDIGQLFTSLTSPTLNLVNAGASFGFTASLDTNTVGTFSATYTLFVSDANLGAVNSRCAGQTTATDGVLCSGFALTLNIIGNVEAAQVPVPATALLLTAGVGLVASVSLARHRRPRR